MSSFKTWFVIDILKFQKLLVAKFNKLFWHNLHYLWHIASRFDSCYVTRGNSNEKKVLWNWHQMVDVLYFQIDLWMRFFVIFRQLFWPLFTTIGPFFYQTWHLNSPKTNWKLVAAFFRRIFFGEFFLTFIFLSVPRSELKVFQSPAGEENGATPLQTTGSKLSQN